MSARTALYLLAVNALLFTTAAASAQFIGPQAGSQPPAATTLPPASVT